MTEAEVQCVLFRFQHPTAGKEVHITRICRRSALIGPPPWFEWAESYAREHLNGAEFLGASVGEIVVDPDIQMEVKS